MCDSFTIVNNDILNDKNLDPMEKLTLIHLLQFYNKEKGYAFPSMKTLTELLKYSHDRYTKKILDGLIEKGYIKRETIKQKNRYFISIGTVQNVPNVQNVPKVQNVPNNTVQNVPNSKVQNVPTTNTNTNTITKTNIGDELKGKKKKDKTFKELIEEYTENENLKITIYDFIDFRKSIKKPMKTNKALTLLFNELNKIARNDSERIAIMEQSIFKGWQGVFPLNNNVIPINKNNIVIPSEPERKYLT